MPALAIAARNWKLIAIVLALAAAVFFWFNGNTLRTERDLEASLKRQAITANESLERALNEQIKDAGLRAYAQTLRAQAAEARAATLSTERRKVTTDGTKDIVGPGTTAGALGLRELARAGDGGKDRGPEAGPGEPDVPRPAADP